MADAALDLHADNFELSIGSERTRKCFQRFDDGVQLRPALAADGQDDFIHLRKYRCFNSNGSSNEISLGICKAEENLPGTLSKVRAPGCERTHRWTTTDCSGMPVLSNKPRLRIPLTAPGPRAAPEIPAEACNSSVPNSPGSAPCPLSREVWRKSSLAQNHSRALSAGSPAPVSPPLPPQPPSLSCFRDLEWFSRFPDFRCCSTFRKRRSGRFSEHPGRSGASNSKTNIQCRSHRCTNARRGP